MIERFLRRTQHVNVGGMCEQFRHKRGNGFNPFFAVVNHQQCAPLCECVQQIDLRASTGTHGDVHAARHDFRQLMSGSEVAEINPPHALLERGEWVLCRRARAGHALRNDLREPRFADAAGSQQRNPAVGGKHCGHVANGAVATNQRLRERRHVVVVRVLRRRFLSVVGRNYSVANLYRIVMQRPLIPATWHGRNHAAAQRFSEHRHLHLNVRFVHRLIGPHELQQFVFVDHPFAPFVQRQQHVKSPPGDGHLRPVDHNAPCRADDFELL